MSNTFFCRLRQEDVTFQNCKRQRILTADRTIEFCSECMEAGLWREYQESLVSVSIEPVTLPEPKQEPQPEPVPVPAKKSKPERGPVSEPVN